MTSDYQEMRKWRRLAILSFAAFVLAGSMCVYQALRIRADEAWMIKAYYGLQVCQQLLAPSAQ